MLHVRKNIDRDNRDYNYFFFFAFFIELHHNYQVYLDSTPWFTFLPLVIHAIGCGLKSVRRQNVKGDDKILSDFLKHHFGAP